jgi:serine/threonine protein kinase
METFKKGEKIGKYVINSFIKKGIVAESYTVLGSDDMMYFMKVFDLRSIPHEQLFEGKEVYEIQLCKELNTEENQNVVRYVDNGEVKKGNAVYHYLVTEFYRGSLLLDAVREEGRFDLEDAVQITLCVLSGLSFIHSRALIHNDIRPSNIMLQELDDGMLMPTIIDLGHISYMVKGRPTFVDEDLMPYFRAPETFRAVYTVKSDIFSTGALLYFLMFGKAPWEGPDLRVFDGDKQKIADALKKARKQELVLETDEVKLPDYMKAILLKALAKKPDDRFASAGEFAQALFEQVMPELAKRMEEEEAKPDTDAQGQDNSGPIITYKKGTGSGFDNVTGRDELKEQLRKELGSKEAVSDHFIQFKVLFLNHGKVFRLGEYEEKSEEGNVSFIVTKGALEDDEDSTDGEYQIFYKVEMPEEDGVKATNYYEYTYFDDGWPRSAQMTIVEESGDKSTLTQFRMVWLSKVW